MQPPGNHISTAHNAYQSAYLIINIPWINYWRNGCSGEKPSETRPTGTRDDLKNAKALPVQQSNVCDVSNLPCGYFCVTYLELGATNLSLDTRNQRFGEEKVL